MSSGSSFRLWFIGEEGGSSLCTCLMLVLSASVLAVRARAGTGDQ